MRQLCSYKLPGSTQWAVIHFIVIETISWYLQHLGNFLQFGKWELLKGQKKSYEYLCHLWSYCVKKTFFKAPTPQAYILPNSHLSSSLQSCVPKLNPIFIPLPSSPCLCHTRVGREAKWLFANVSAGFAAVPKFVSKAEKRRTQLHACSLQGHQRAEQGEHSFFLTILMSSLPGAVGLQFQWPTGVMEGEGPTAMDF